jgi:hypothetical protein
VGKGYLTVTKDGEKTTYTATEEAAEYLTLFSKLYQSVFDQIPGFKL